MLPGQGVAWMGAFADRVRAARPPLGLIIAPDLSGAGEALDAAAIASERPVVRVIAVPGEANVPLSALRAAVPGLDGDDQVKGRDALVASSEGCVLVVEDAHWLDDASLTLLAGLAARSGTHDVGLLIAHRPSPAPALADLDGALGAQGVVVRADGLEPDEISGRLAARRNRPVAAELVDLVVDLTAGRLGLIDLLVDDWMASGRDDEVATGATEVAATVGPAVLDALRLRIDRLPAPARTLLAVMAAIPTAPDDVIADAAGLAADDVAEQRAATRDAGLLEPGEGPPVVVARVAADDALGAAERRDRDRRIGAALAERYGAEGAAAEHLAAAGATGPEAAAAYVAAARAVEGSDPAAARDWYERALASGGDRVEARAALAELHAILGDRQSALRLADEVLREPTADPAARARAARAAAAVSHRSGHTDRALAFLATASEQGDPDAPLLGATLAWGRGIAAPEPAALAATADVATTALQALARSTRRAVRDDPSDGVRPAFEVLSLLAGSSRAVALPEAPAVLGAIAALVAGDAPAARQLLGAAGPGGLHTANVEAWSAWVALVAGEPLASTPIGSPEPDPASRGAARESVVASAVDAGRARRSGDVSALHESWRRVEPLLVEVEPDLWLLEPAVELAAAAVRLDPRLRTAGWLDSIGHAMDQVGAAAPWFALLAWGRLQVAVTAGDVAGVDDAAAVLAALPPLPAAHEALRRAAGVWTDVSQGRVDPDAVLPAADALEQTGRRWDASRLVGQAAVRTSDPAIARALLSRARELSDAPAPPTPTEGEAPASAILSERECEVGRLVLEGRTHKEIGAQLFLSPKTVEHHVARIRTKLGAATRAEMLAALRRELG